MHERKVSKPPGPRNSGVRVLACGSPNRGVAAQFPQGESDASDPGSFQAYPTLQLAALGDERASFKILAIGRVVR